MENDTQLKRLREKYVDDEEGLAPADLDPLIGKAVKVRTINFVLGVVNQEVSVLWLYTPEQVRKIAPKECRDDFEDIEDFFVHPVRGYLGRHVDIIPLSSILGTVRLGVWGQPRRTDEIVVRGTYVAHKRIFRPLSEVETKFFL
jgi:hypothetical protein